MSLKTDYKDAMYDGARRYRITLNADGTSGIADDTVYTQEGDQFGASDINATNAAVNRLGAAVSILIPASGWSEDAPYTQTVDVEGVTAEDVPVIGICIDDGTASSDVKVQSKAWSCVDRAVTGDGTVTFYCYNKKPADDFRVVMKGVG
jgi:hypothetical protein